MTITMTKLAPCPYCGDNQQLNHVELSNGLHYIECERCGATPYRLGAWDYETAVKYWNQRTGESEQRHGRWIWFESEGTFVHLRKCSECGDIKTQAETNFCPNCGAQMNGGADDAGRK